MKNKNYEMNKLFIDLEDRIEKYDNSLKHIVNGKKEYINKDKEFVGESFFVFEEKEVKIIENNLLLYRQLVDCLDVRFTNIIVTKATAFNLHYKLKQIN